MYRITIQSISSLSLAYQGGIYSESEKDAHSSRSPFRRIKFGLAMTPLTLVTPLSSACFYPSAHYTSPPLVLLGLSSSPSSSSLYPNSSHDEK